MNPVSFNDIPTSTTHASTSFTTSATAPNPIATLPTSPSLNHHHSNTSTLPRDTASALESLYEEEIPEKGNNEEENGLSEVLQILENMENGKVDESLPRISAEDVSFDMDKVFIEEYDYYTDGTTSSDSDDESDVSLEGI